MPQDIKDDDDTITALLRALEGRDFKYRLRTEDTIRLLCHEYQRKVLSTTAEWR